MTWVFPYPVGCSTNHLYETVHTPEGTTRRQLQARARAWREWAIVIVRQSNPPRYTGHLAVRIEAASAREHYDLDNLLKLTLDSVCAGLGIDDHRIDDIHISRVRDGRPPSLTVTMLEVLP